jgi:plastocyanin
MQNAGRFALALALVFALAACGGNGGNEPPPTPVFTSLTVSPADPNLIEGDTLQLTATPRDQNGAAMTGLPAATFALTTGTSVSVSLTGRVVALGPGGSTVTASLTSGTTTKTATATPDVTAIGSTETVTASGAGTAFNPDTAKVELNAGGQATVTWSFTNGNNLPHNVTFTSGGPTEGNIPNQANAADVARTFTTVGRHAYHCTIHSGMNGVVVVRDLP